MTNDSADEQRVEKQLDKLFNKPAGDKAFYLRGELEPKIKALLAERDRAARLKRLEELIGILDNIIQLYDNSNYSAPELVDACKKQRDVIIAHLNQE